VDARAAELVELALGQGFALAGVSDAAPTRYREELLSWLAAGKHGSMAYMAEHVGARLDPNLVLKGARSVLMVADVYAPRGRDDVVGKRRGRVARYARGGDYHVVMKRRLHALADTLRAKHPEHQFRVFVDTAPVLEREYAVRAGLGWVAKNSLLIHPRAGSYLLLGGIFTTLPVENAGAPAIDHCGTCTRCIDACPTGAITPYSVDASRCISYLTIERRLPIDERFHAAIGDWIYGCDICQEVCPHNSARPAGVEAAPARPEYAPARDSFDLLDVLEWSEEARRRAFQGSAMKRATLAMMKRNAVIAAGNALRAAPDVALRTRLEELAGDLAEPEMVRDAARTVLASHGGGATVG
jgi:epoxyqueuosine reductase